MVLKLSPTVFFELTLLKLRSIRLFCRSSKNEKPVLTLCSVVWWHNIILSCMALNISCTFVGHYFHRPLLGLKDCTVWHCRYGELSPSTFPGKLIGGLCALCGIFILTLPIPIVVNSFASYYKNRLWRNEVSFKKRVLSIYLSRFEVAYKKRERAQKRKEMEVLMKDNLLNILTVPGTPIRFSRNNISMFNTKILKIFSI